MYKVFFNNNLLELIPLNEFQESNNSIITYHNGMDWSTILDQLFRQEQIVIQIQSETLEDLWQSFQNEFVRIDAAGGLVFNDKDEMLFIHRLGKWDLPKGKMEQGEKPNETAAREVEEECGIHNLKIISEPFLTYHTYHLNGENVLKRTYWYKMKYTGNENLVPQTEEDITEVIWKKRIDLDQVLDNTYPSIIDVLDSYGAGNE